ncbi:CRISPR-associated endoribonuclease Cas6 [Roseburia faecis]|uniref:CRISPR-associated endoribonuclease Cas6 n=1 Tax=Roseburia faecis TaxID=301302 RepID=UPI003F9A7606
MEIAIYEISLKIYTLVDIPTEQLLGKEAAFIDSALGLDDQWIKYHEDNKYKLYSYDMLYPIEKDGGYLKDHIYTFRIRTVNVDLAKYFSQVLPNHYTRELKGLVAENRILPKKTISEIYTLTSVVMKFEDGYWRGKYPIEVFEQRLFSNAVKKYKQYTGEEVNEDFQWYTQITFLNKKPVPLSYDSKKIKLLGDKINLKIADNKQAQELTYFMLGAGLGELNSRGAGTCNYRYL